MPGATSDIPIFIINLQQDVEKREHMTKLCNEQGLSTQFIAAVDGGLLDPQELAGVYVESEAKSAIGRSLSRSEIGCALSHRSIYQMMVDQNIPVALILEDDIEFDHDLLAVIGQLDRFPECWQIVLLGHHSGNSRTQETHFSFWDKQKLIGKYALTRPVEFACGTYGYLLKLEAAKIILSDLEIIRKPIDHLTGVDSKLNLFTASPAPVRIQPLLHDKFHSMSERKKLQKKQERDERKTISVKILKFFHLYRVAHIIRSYIVNFRLSLRKPRVYR